MLPDEIPVPQAWLELDVESVERAMMLVKNKKEPWGTDRQPVLVAGGTAPWDHAYSVDAIEDRASVHR
jgi:hypothetical protein